MRKVLSSSSALAAVFLIGCAAEATSSLDPVYLLSVSPTAASTGVSTSSSIVMTFSRPMMAGMEARIVVHEGSVTGPAVAGVASWSVSRTVLTFVPSAAFKPRTTYVIHLGGDMRDTDGRALDHAGCSVWGGRVVTGGMMGLNGGMMGGSNGGMMGPGWQSVDGTYGMIFTFTTG